MFKYIWQRIAFAILALFIISILTFNLVALFAPDPLSKVAQREVEGATGHIKPTYDAVLLRLRIEHGIMYSKDHPVPIIVTLDILVIFWLKVTLDFYMIQRITPIQSYLPIWQNYSLIH